jgi:hypothetical protein
MNAAVMTGDGVGVQVKPGGRATLRTSPHAVRCGAGGGGGGGVVQPPARETSTAAPAAPAIRLHMAAL